jgi:hypothetical protein
MELIRLFALVGKHYIPHGGTFRTTLPLVQIEVQEWRPGRLLDPFRFFLHRFRFYDLHGEVRCLLFTFAMCHIYLLGFHVLMFVVLNSLSPFRNFMFILLYFLISPTSPVHIDFGGYMG